MSDPVLVEVLRGKLVESRHRGAIAVVDAGGKDVLALGDVTRPVFPRSAVKALQALPLVESGAAGAFGFGDEELAIACGSHGGEPMHVAVVARMLARSGLEAAALECGTHWPMDPGAARALVRAGLTPSALHNNCSGKHAGFLGLVRYLGAEKRGYGHPGHPVQREVKATLEALSGVTIAEEWRAIDGCSVPTWALPLRALALAFARLGAPDALAGPRRAAARRLRAACARHPELVAGSGRFCTRVTAALGERVFIKTGAEGVTCAALPDAGLGIAAKCDDGSGRAAELVMAVLLGRLVTCDSAGRETLARLIKPALTNWNGLVVGSLRPSRLLVRAAGRYGENRATL